MINRVKILLKKIVANESGAAFIEFSVLLPVLLMLFYGTVELTKAMYGLNEIEKMAYEVADQLTIGDSVAKTGFTKPQLQSALDGALGHIKSSGWKSEFPKGSVIVTLVQTDAGGVPSAKWTYRCDHGGAAYPSQIVFGGNDITAGTSVLTFTADVPAPTHPLANYEVLVVEVISAFVPQIQSYYFANNNAVFNMYRSTIATPLYESLPFSYGNMGLTDASCP